MNYRNLNAPKPNNVKIKDSSPGQCGLVGRVLPHEPKSHQFNSSSGHTLQSWVWQYFSHQCYSRPLPSILSNITKKINKNYKMTDSIQSATEKYFALQIWLIFGAYFNILSAVVCLHLQMDSIYIYLVTHGVPQQCSCQTQYLPARS